MGTTDTAHAVKDNLQAIPHSNFRGTPGDRESSGEFEFDILSRVLKETNLEEKKKHSVNTPQQSSDLVPYNSQVALVHHTGAVDPAQRHESVKQPVFTPHVNDVKATEQKVFPPSDTEGVKRPMTVPEFLWALRPEGKAALLSKHPLVYIVVDNKPTDPPAVSLSLLKLMSPDVVSNIYQSDETIRRLVLSFPGTLISKSHVSYVLNWMRDCVNDPRLFDNAFNPQDEFYDLVGAFRAFKLFGMKLQSYNVDVALFKRITSVSFELLEIRTFWSRERTRADRSTIPARLLAYNIKRSRTKYGASWATPISKYLEHPENYELKQMVAKGDHDIEAFVEFRLSRKDLGISYWEEALREAL